MANQEAKLCRLVSELGRVCERRKLRVNEGKSKVIGCWRYVNVGGMDAGLNGEPSEETDCFKYLGSSVAADGGCVRDVVLTVVHRVNEEYRASGARKVF